MISVWIKNIKTLTWLRLGASLVLIFLAYWVFSDLEIRNRWIEVTPTAYFWGANIRVAKNISGLVIPIMVNMAIWIPRYYSYIFIRVVLYAEFIKLAITVAIFLLAFIRMFPLSLIMMLNPYFIVSMIALITLNIFLITSWEKQTIKEYFKADSKTEPELRSITNKMVIIFMIAIFAVCSINSNVRTVVQQNYAHVSTYDIYHKDLKYKENNGIVYINTPRYGVGHQARLSADEKMLLLRIRSIDDDGKDLFIFDTANMKNTQILKTPIVEKAKRTISGYDFTRDGKYIVVGDEASTEDNVKFQVLNIATGKPDKRFSDANKVSKIALTPYIKDVGIVEFNPSGNCFAIVMTSARIVEIWDYTTGKLVFTEVLPNSIDTFNWVSDNEFLVSYYQNYDNSEVAVYLYELSTEFYSKKIKKEQISKDMSKKTQGFLTIKTSIDSKYAASFRDNPSSSASFTINIWDIKNDQNLATINRVKKIQDIAFHPNNKTLVILESFSDKTGLISFLNIRTGKNEREIKIPQVSVNWDLQTRNGYGHIRLIDNGKKIMLIGTKVHIIALE